MKNKLFAILFNLILIMFFLSSSAQQNEIKYIVTGKIIDSISKQALSYANIGLLKESDNTFVKGTTSEMDGNFEIQGIKSGKYLLKISYMGYNPPLIQLTLQ